MNLIRRILRKLKAPKNLKYGHQNHTKVEGNCVVKNFVGKNAHKRFKTEKLALEKFRSFVPLPKLISADEDTLEIRMELINGINGADVNEGEMGKLQFESGTLLKRIHSIPLDVHEGEFKGHSGKLLHGDYTIRNLLVSEKDHSILAVIDWEKLCIGHPMKDIYWYEWVFRRSYNVTLAQLNAFFLGYGIAMPEWDIRRTGMLKLLQAAIDHAKDRDDATGIHYWKEQYSEAKKFKELV